MVKTELLEKIVAIIPPFTPLLAAKKKHRLITSCIIPEDTPLLNEHENLAQVSS